MFSMSSLNLAHIMYMYVVQNVPKKSPFKDYNLVKKVKILKILVETIFVQRKRSIFNFIIIVLFTHLKSSPQIFDAQVAHRCYLQTFTSQIHRHTFALPYASCDHCDITALSAITIANHIQADRLIIQNVLLQMISRSI